MFGIITLFSRFVGLVREQVTAFYLGTTASADAYGIAFLMNLPLVVFLMTDHLDLSYGEASWALGVPGPQRAGPDSHRRAPSARTHRR